MKRSSPRLPRKLKKAMNGLEIYTDTGEVHYRPWFRLRRYPRTKWVVRAEHQFRHLWRELGEKDEAIQKLERQLQVFKGLGL